MSARYQVSNRHTGKVSRYVTLTAACKAMDRMDNAYGAVCCSLRRLPAEVSAA